MDATCTAANPAPSTTSTMCPEPRSWKWIPRAWQPNGSVWIRLPIIWTRSVATPFWKRFRRCVHGVAGACWRNRTGSDGRATAAPDGYGNHSTFRRPYSMSLASRAMPCPCSSPTNFKLVAATALLRSRLRIGAFPRSSTSVSHTQPTLRSVSRRPALPPRVHQGGGEDHGAARERPRARALPMDEPGPNRVEDRFEQQHGGGFEGRHVAHRASQTPIGQPYLKDPKV